MKKLAVALALAALTLGSGFAADQEPATNSSTTSTTNHRKTGKHHRRHHKKSRTTNSGQSGTQAPSK